jgi:DNA invertase Pin-like site-specific DNA recombinase
LRARVRRYGFGALDSRLELSRCLDYLHEGDTLVVWRLDRLGRSLRQLMDTVAELEARGIALYSLTENLDTSSAGGRLVFHIFGALAEFERDLIRERTLAGLAAARARGHVGGRPTVMNAQKLQSARTLLAAGQQTTEAVAQTLGVSRSTLYRHLGRGRISA